MSVSKNNCQHLTDRVIRTGIGKFCLDCGQITGRPVAHKKIIHNPSTRLPKTISDIRPASKNNSAITIKAASIRPKRVRV